MKIKDMPYENQPQTRLLEAGPEALSNAELLAIIMRTGIKEKNVMELSNELFRRYPLHTLPATSVHELKKMFGIGETKAAQIVSFFELARRSSYSVQKSKREIRNSKSAYEHFKPILQDKKQEHFYAIFLDARKKIITQHLLFLGTNNAALIHPRDILAKAISANASSFIMVHNHPSGDATPSREDIEVTQRLSQNAELMDIPLLDHIIVGQDSYYSMRDMGII